MNIKDYLSDSSHERKLIITSDVARTNKLIRAFEKKTGTSVMNVICKSIKSIAEQLYLYFESEKGYVPEYVIIDDAAAAMLLRSVMLSSVNALSYFGKEKMLTLATSSEIYAKLNLIRGCGWNGTEDVYNARVNDMKLIADKYEDALRAAKYLDYNALLDYIADCMVQNPACNAMKECFGASVVFIKEDAEKYTAKEMTLLGKIEAEEVAIWDQKPGSDVMQTLAAKTSFFRGYGSFNEARFVANDILKNNVPLGDVCVLYTDEAQLNALESAFGGNGIKASFTSQKSLKDNMFVALARRILAWAKDVFSEKSLAYIYDSPALRGEYIDATSGNAVNAAGGRYYFKHVLDARTRRNDGFILGWGYERNLAFVAHEEALASDVRTKKALEIHGELLAIFGDGGKIYDGAEAVRPLVIYDQLLSFIWKYQNRSSDLKEGKGGLTGLRSMVAMEDKALPLSESIEYLDELISNLKGKDELASDSAEIALLSDWEYIDRDRVYITGLSLKEMQANTVESPILTDDEMENWLGDGYKPTVSNKTELKNLNIYRTLATFDGDALSLGYSFYDTVSFTNNSPSVFYRGAVSACGKKLEEVCEFVYGNPIAASTGNASSAVLKSDYPVKLNTSNSTIEKLLDCPKMYYYSEIARIPDNEYVELAEDQWLDAMRYGSLFHCIAQRYVDSIFIKPACEAYSSVLDTELLNKIIEEEADKFSQAFPIPSVNQKNYEVRKLKDVCEMFFTKVHDTLAGDDLGWRMLMTEKRFDEEPCVIEDYLGNKYDFRFKGEIDRIDYKIDAESRVIYLRIADYKTGKHSSKEKSLNLGKVVQHAIYMKAIQDILLPEVLKRASELEGNPDVMRYEPVFSDFTYYFPKEADDWKLMINASDAEGINISRLRAELTAISDLSEYPDHSQLYEKICEYAIAYVSLDPSIVMLREAMTNKKQKLQDHEWANCKYCRYVDICPSARGGKTQ